MAVASEVVDIDDLVALIGTYGKSAGDPDFLWYFDYDGNGTVDVGDLARFLLRFGQ